MKLARRIYSFPTLNAWGNRLRGREPKAPAFARLPDRAIQTWRERQDLRDAFDLSLPRGRAGLFWWCLLHGFREMGFRYNETLDGEFLIANQPFPGLPQASFLPVTWLMRALWLNSPSKPGTFLLPEDQYACIADFVARGLNEANLSGFLTEEQAALLRENDPITGRPRLYDLLWHSNPSLKEQFTSSGSDAFDAWCRNEGARDYPILAHPLIDLAPPPQRKPRRGKVRGVNLFGHALGRFGVGEEVRMAAKCLDAADIPYVIRNVVAPAAGQDETLEGVRFADDLPFDVNIFSMTGISTVSAAIAEGGRFRDGRHSIGIWPWELPEWPVAWDHAWDYVDEVWATSRFTYDAYARSARVPILHMPTAVVADATEGLNRSDFGLPSDTFLFGFSFDGLSSLARKNPHAAIAAFQRAFPATERGVGLVMKGIRVAEKAPAWRGLLNQIGDDQRIHIINDSMPRGRLLDLYRALDVFVSLHRSEGFGRNIAEAMLLAKPVIVSAHSGNMDFTEHDTAALIPITLSTVADGDYPFGAGQMWGEPNIEAASQAMRRMIDDKPWRERLAQRAQKAIIDKYSPEVAATAWSNRLKNII